MRELYDKLLRYGQSDFYPYHMPGHKRQPLTGILERTAALDVTEIEGFDNLHRPGGILKQVQRRAAFAYGADESFYLVNGSTSGVLAAVCAAVPEGGRILMARNCHRCAWHAAYLRGLRTSFLFPRRLEPWGIAGPVTPSQVERALSAEPDIRAVLLTSPTYEGVVSDVAGIAEVSHRHGIPLIVDEAHGAHLGFHPAWPLNATRLGADLCVQSLHKTLPSMNQTALLHVKGNLADAQRLRRFLSVFQTSSPSYVMMAGMEEAVSLMEEQGAALFELFLARWNNMMKELRACRRLSFFPDGGAGAGHDIGKLVVSVRGTGVGGQELYDILRERYHLQLEMAGGTYALAMFTVADTEEGYRRLTDALLEIDAALAPKPSGRRENISLFPKPGKVMELWEAWEKETEEISLDDCEGRTAGDFIMLYPPGTPVIAPGERFDRDTADLIRAYIRRNLPVQGVKRRENAAYVTVLKLSGTMERTE